MQCCTSSHSQLQQWWRRLRGRLGLCLLLLLVWRLLVLLGRHRVLLTSSGFRTLR
jgi:hypothetical protein